MRVVATAGHVDHGKSSLVRALTGTDPDRWEQEKRRGLSIDLGFAFTTLPTGEVLSFIDVPGHIRFLRNMLAGVGGVDACVLVVAATEGWKPQTEEHLRIIDLLGVRHGVIAVTKCDIADEATCAKTLSSIAKHVVGTFLEHAPVVSVSSTTGAGLDLLRAHLAHFVANESRSPNRHRPRIWIDRVFSAKGSGTVVTGTLTDGALRVGDELITLPTQAAVKVRGIQTHGAAVEFCEPGQRCALNLTGVDHHQLHRGCVLVHAEQWKPSHCCDASLTVLQSLPHDVSHRGNFLMYIGTAEIAVTLGVIGADHIAASQTGAVRLRWQTDLPLLPGDRFILRETGREETIGGGEILDIHPIRVLANATPNRSVDRLIGEHGWILPHELELLTGVIVIPNLGEWIVSPAEVSSTIDAVRAKVAQAGESGVELASLSQREQAAIGLIAEIQVITGRVLPLANDGIAHHPCIELFAKAGCTPPDIRGFDAAIIRQLVQRNILVNCSGVIFHSQAITQTTTAVQELLRQHPDGFSVSQIREALQISRKYAVPLVEYLDTQGVTRRRADLRIAGPRLFQ